jgi:hypothetical protein
MGWLRLAHFIRAARRSQMAKLVKMVRDGHEVDVHPDMVADYKAGGFVATLSTAKPITREGIDKMRKADVVELLDAHGAETDGKLAEMRDRLKAVMFVGL